MSLGSIWVNGRRESPGVAHVSARDRGFALGDGVFETMRVESGVVFRLDQHLARLHRGLEALEIPAPSELGECVLIAAQAAPPGHASIRLTVTRGVGAAGVPTSGVTSPTVIAALNPMPVFPSEVYESGLTAHIVSGRRNEQAMTSGLKTLGYTDNVAAWLEARRASADEAIFLDTAGHCSEATASNLFAWTGGVLVTPPLSCGVLPGITRAAIIELAPAVGMVAAERVLELTELLTAEEAFLTSSLRGIAPLVRVGSHTIGHGRPGPYTRRLSAAYSALVTRECRDGDRARAQS